MASTQTVVETEPARVHVETEGKEDEEPEELRAVMSMAEHLQKFREALQDMQGTASELAEGASEILDAVAETAPQLSVLAALVGGGALAGNPAAQAILQVLSGALHTLIAPGITLTGPVLVASAGVLVGITSIIKMLQAKQNKKRIQAVSESLGDFQRDYLDELEKIDKSIEIKIEQLIAFIQEQLNKATSETENRTQVDFVSAMKFNGLLVGIKNDFYTFQRLINSGRQQLGVILAAAKEAEEVAEKSKSDGKASVYAGTIVIAVGVLVAIGSGGAAIPLLVAGSAAVGGAVAVGAGMYTMSLAKEQLEELGKIKQQIDKFHKELDGYQDKLNGKMEQLDRITQKLGGELEVMRQLVEENRRKDREMKQMQDMMERMQEEMNRMRLAMAQV